MRKVVFSAVTGGYDAIEQPLFIHPDYDYILFSNDIKEDNIGVWQIQPIPYYNKDNTKIARWVKTHPQLLLPNYEFSVWIDSNVIISAKEAYSIFDNLYEQGVLISSFAHPFRDCIYDECLWIALRLKDKFKNMLPEILYLKENGYPQHAGLCETNCVFRCHTNPTIIDVCEKWWQMIDKYSKRDQLSFNFILWKKNIELNYLLGKEFCSRNHPYFHRSLHAVTPYEDNAWRGFMEKRAKKVYSNYFYKIINAKSHSLSEKIYYVLLISSEKIMQLAVCLLFKFKFYSLLKACKSIFH